MVVLKRLSRVLMLTVLFLLGLTFPAWANLDWTQPYKAPSIYARANHPDYTFQHYTEFRYDEGNGPQGPLDFGWSSVFNPPDAYLQGWTAVGTKDEIYPEVERYLSVLGIPFVDGYYIVSPAFWGQQGSIPNPSGSFIPYPLAPSPDNSEALHVPVQTVKIDSGLDQKSDTIDNPKCFCNGPGGQGFEAGGYHGSQGYHWFSKYWNSPIAVTQKAATKMWMGSSTTWAKICYKYLYNVSATHLESGSVQNGKQRWTAHFLQNTPFLAKDVVLRAYIVQNGKYTLAASTTTDIGPIPLGNGQGGRMPLQLSPRYGQGVRQDGSLHTVAWDFEVPVPTGAYRLVVTANLQYTKSGAARPEPLKTVGAYGLGGASVPQLTGTKSEVKPFLPWHGSNPYDDNWVDGTGQGWQPPGPGTQPGANDLAVTDIQVLDAETGQPVSSPQENQNLKVKAKFASGFDVGGWAKVRLYKYQADYKRLDEIRSENVYFDPHSVCTKEWSVGNIGTGQYKFIATVCLYNTGNDPATEWQTEKFDGKHTETTYDNNRKEADLTGTDAPPREPQPREESAPAWYPPLAWKEKPIYETYTEPVYGWKKVKFTKEEAQAKVRVRLVE